MTAPNVTPPNPQTPPPPSTSGAPSGPTGGSATPTAPASSSAAQDTGFRYAPGAGIPDYLVGKTAAEAADLVSKLYQQNVQLSQAQWAGHPQPVPSYTPGQPAAPSYQPAPPSYVPVAPAAPTPPAPEDWLSDQAGAAKRYADYLAATQFQPQMQAQAAVLAQSSRAIVQMQRADEFRRWGPEIDMTLNQMAPNPSLRTPENINAVVDIVKARHLQELIAEERGKFTNELGGTSLRPSAGGGTPSAMGGATVDLDKLPPGYRDALKSLNVDQRTIDEFLYRTYVKSGMEQDLDKARDRWVKQVQRGDVFSDNRTLDSAIYA